MAKLGDTWLPMKWYTCITVELTVEISFWLWSSRGRENSFGKGGISQVFPPHMKNRCVLCMCSCTIHLQHWLLMCVFTRYDNKGCGRSYLSQRDLQAHIAYRHKDKSTSTVTSLSTSTNLPQIPLPPFFAPHPNTRDIPANGMPVSPDISFSFQTIAV